MALNWQGLLLVATGGAAGSVLRWVVGVLAPRMLGSGFPFGTLIVNLTGSFAIGLIAGWATAGAFGVTAPVRLFLITGVMGGFTTFSSFSLETVALTRGGEIGLAALYVAGSVALGIAACFGGLATARAVLP